MGNSYYCCNPPLPDKRFEIRNNAPINSSGGKKKSHQYDEEKNSTTINPSNYNLSDDAIENDNKSKQQQSQQGNFEQYDNYDEEQFDSIIIHNVLDIQKQSSIYKSEMKLNYIAFSKVFEQQLKKYNCKFKVDEKIIKQEIFSKMFKKELIINQKEQQDAKLRLENFLMASQEEYLNLKKFSVWFDEDWYEDYDEIMRTIKDMVVNLPSQLEELVLNFWGMKIGIEGTRQLSRGLKKQRKLKKLDINLDTGDVGNIGVSQIGTVIGQKQDLNSLKLNLSSNDLDLLGISKLCLGLQNLKMMDTFDLILSDNKIGHEGGIVLAECIQQLVKIKQMNINLQNNMIGDNSAIALMEQICQLPILNYIYIGLSDNQITDVGLNKFKEELLKCQSNKFSKLIIGLSQNSIELEQQQKFEQSLRNHFSPDTTLYIFF